MHFKIFSSGSDGNSSILKTEKYNILIDCGITLKSIVSNLEEIGLNLASINFMFITHEHEDHIKAFAMMLKYDNIKIYLTLGTFQGIIDRFNKTNKLKQIALMQERVKNNTIVLLYKKESSIFYDDLKFDGLDVKVLPAFHDANETVGYSFIEGEKKFVYLTDTGYVHNSLFEYISNADCYMLECNHDPSLLMYSNRPYYLKTRILSEHGHLSNEDSMVALVKLIGDRTKLVIHAHVSQECNLSQIIIDTRKKVFDDYGMDISNIEFVIACPHPSKEFII